MPAAAVWVTGSITGSPQIQSDAVRTSSTCASATDATFPSGGSKYLNIITPQTMPSAKAIPTTGTFYTLNNISSNTDVPGKELPRASDTADTDGVYKYIVNSFDSSLKIAPGKRVWLWVTGNIDLRDKVIVNQCGASGSLTNCGPFDFRIYPQSASVTPSPTLTLDRSTATCDVFFHLPGYTVNFENSGTATTQDCGSGATNTSIYWVQNWNGGVSGTTILNSPRTTWSTAVTTTSDYAVTGLTVPPLNPSIGPSSVWQIQSDS
ncbi:hypothetical protein [Altericista sp. CCNU0014]|uniref:hypothetical protein n=1 Tax=Altericista sp. CCNU0014 TaxID=3082949 RepID=UPI00384C64FB